VAPIAHRNWISDRSLVRNDFPLNFPHFKLGGVSGSGNWEDSGGSNGGSEGGGSDGGGSDGGATVAVEVVIKMPPSGGSVIFPGVQELSVNTVCSQL